MSVLVDATVNEPVVSVAWGGSVTMAGSCLGIDGATAIWPHGTKITSHDPLTIDVPGLGQLSVGDVVSSGGEPSDPTDTDPHLPRGIKAVPSGCPTRGLVYIYAN